MVRVGPRLTVIYDKNKDMLRFYVDGNTFGNKVASDYRNYLNHLQNIGGGSESGLQKWLNEITS